MSLVLDASVCVAALVDNGREGQWAERMLREGPLYAPELILAESAKVLRRLSRAGQLTDREASMAHQDLVNLDLNLFPYEPFADRIWDLRHNLTSYDAWYIALAEELEIPIATLDERIIKAAGPKCDFEKMEQS